MVENRIQISRGALREALAGAGLSVLNLHNGLANDGSPLVLVEVDGYLAADDPRLARLAADQNRQVLQTRVIGGYAVPLGAEELAGDEAGET